MSYWKLNVTKRNNNNYNKNNRRILEIEETSCHSNSNEKPSADANVNNSKGVVTIIIITIMSCRLHGYPWPSLATSPYHSSPLAGLQGYISYPNIAAVCMFELVVLLLLGHMRGSITDEFVLASPAVSCMSGSSNLYSFRDGRQLAV